jgi:hypothetical protein
MSVRAQEGTYTKAGGIAGVLGVVMAAIGLALSQTPSKSTPPGAAPSVPTAPSVTGSAESRESNPRKTASLLPAGIKVRHQGRVVVRPGRSVDMDARQDDPLWTGEGKDLSYDGEALETYSAGEDLSLAGATKPGYVNCYTDGPGYYVSLGRNDMDPGSYLCHRTDRQRIAVLKVVNVSRQKLTLDAVVYDTPGD